MNTEEQFKNFSEDATQKASDSDEETPGQEDVGREVVVREFEGNNQGS